MKYYFAPMEGVTGYLYRNVHHSMFPGIDKYFTPFVSPNQNRCFTPRERRDILPENNKGTPVVPQILTNRADYFIRTVKELEVYGYEEVNLNLGCPSGTVVSKGKGAGFLEDTDKLDAFLETVFENLQKEAVGISVKTRIGMEEAEEFEDILKVFNRYPLEEIIIHPRVREDYYKNQPDWKTFEYALEKSQNPVCYNGDIFSVADYERLQEEFQDVKILMCGRGLLSNPALIRTFTGGSTLTKEELCEFHNRIYEGYKELFAPDERSVLFKMKELWSYLSALFTESEKELKKIRKAQRFAEYEVVVSEVLEKYHN